MTGYEKAIISKIAGRKLTIDVVDEIVSPYSGRKSYPQRRSIIKRLWYDQYGKTKESFAEIEWYFENNKGTAHRHKIFTKYYINDQQLESILLNTRTKKQYLFIKFLSITGVRVSEMCDIKLNDVQHHVGFVQINYKAKKTGLDCYRNIPLDVYDEIRKEFFGKDYLFETSGGKRYYTNYISQQIKKVSTKAIGVPISAHILRHYWSTKKHEEHADPFTVSRMMGHKNVGSRYANYVHKQQEEAL